MFAVYLILFFIAVTTCVYFAYYGSLEMNKKSIVNARLALFVSFLIAFTFLGFRYNVGRDFINYMGDYKYIDSSDFGETFSYYKNDVDMSFLDKYISEENIQEDKRITAEYFKLVTIDELISCVILIMTISSCFIYNETKTCLDDCLYDNDQTKIKDTEISESIIKNL